MADLPLIYGAETKALIEGSSFSGVAVETTIKRTGAASYKHTGVAAGESLLWDSGISPIWCRFYFRFPSAPGSDVRILEVRGTSSTDICSIIITANRKLKAFAEGGTESAEGSTVLATDEWHLIECKFTKGTGTDTSIEVFVEGSSEVSSTDGTVIVDARRIRTRVDLASWVSYLDDIHISSTALPGAGQIEVMRPDGDSGDSGEDEFEDEAANASTWEAVSEDPLSETEYAIESSQADADHRQLWTLDSLSADTVNAVNVTIWAKRGNGGATEHRIRSKVSTAENSADLGLGASAAYYSYAPSTQPTAAQLSTFQAGVWRDNGGREFFCYEHYVMVDHTPSGVVPNVESWHRPHPGPVPEKTGVVPY
jgi:hypothetical protein